LVENSHRDIVLLRVYKGLLAWIINQSDQNNFYIENGSSYADGPQSFAAN
jgi:hypothetical protein